MKKLKAKLKKQGGFTLIEMLIVVAIIAILIAVSIPLVSGALEKARDATDQANERAAKAETTLVFTGLVDNDADSDYVAGTEIGAAGKELYYDAEKGTLVKDPPTNRYGRCTGGSDCDPDYTNAGKHTDCVIQVTMKTDGTFEAKWVNP